jgi:nucleotide-binding universal stress UspA family protein
MRDAPGHDVEITPPLDQEPSMSDPVLVGVALDDRDSGPIALGVALAGLAGGRLALVHSYAYDQGGIAAAEYEAELREAANGGLERLGAALPEQIEVTLHSYASVSPAQALHAAAEALRPLAIVVGSTHRGRVGHVLPGGVGERLLHGAPCPVAIAPHGYAGGPAELTEIGVAFDDGPAARDALHAAIELARATGARVSTYTATEPIETAPAAMVPGWSTPPGYSVSRRERAEQILQSARERVPADMLGGTNLLTGHAADALAQASLELDLLVCGSRGYGPLRSVLVGGVSSALAHTAACPLLVVPRGDGLRLDAMPTAPAAAGPGPR